MKFCIHVAYLKMNLENISSDEKNDFKDKITPYI